MIKRQISFLFEDPGFCIDVFCTIAEPVRYYNRDTESGAWYSSTPDWNENGSLIREDLIFEVIADGVVCALDGNGNFEGKKPFVPFCQFRQSRICCDSQNIVKRYFRNNKKSVPSSLMECGTDFLCVTLCLIYYLISDLDKCSFSPAKLSMP